ncbi:MAG: galactose-1-phosphate uridylyltransferase [Dehalococcoidales bacterium]|nr:galactose-1-phosphate uridylyltransferase [Dehalococcoidales bacterium]
MSELRQDPTTREWVIIAPERGKRPQQAPRVKHAEDLPGWDAACPFCLGNESQTPDEVFRVPSPEGDSSWAVRVVPNRFPTLVAEADMERTEEGHFARKMGGFGVHEVIIESPHHNELMALMTYEQVERVLSAYQQRYNALKENHHLKFITIFKNHGWASGTSLIHPHSQLVATPIITPYYHRRYDVAHDYLVDMGGCLYCEMLAEELKGGKRIVAETDQFVIFHPYASRASWESWIVPKEHCASFGLVPHSRLAELSTVLKDTLFCMYSELDNPAFNLMVDTSTTVDEDDPYYHWHIRIVPRLTTIAGFEIGSGIYISPALPEETARLMRQCCIAYLKEGKVCLIPPPEV